MDRNSVRECTKIGYLRGLPQEKKDILRYIGVYIEYVE